MQDIVRGNLLSFRRPDIKENIEIYTGSELPDNDAQK